MPLLEIVRTEKTSKQVGAPTNTFPYVGGISLNLYLEAV